MKVIQFEDNIILIEEFLSPKSCSSLIRRSEAIGYEKSKIQLSNGQQVVNESVRNNERILHFDMDLASIYWEKAKSYIPAKFGIYTAYGLNEMFRFYKYEKGQQFKMHADGSYTKNEHESSFFTFMIYLNDDFEGGETVFEDKCVVKPKTGSLLLFYHPLRHQGNIVDAGFKYVLRTDVMYKK